MTARILPRPAVAPSAARPSSAREPLPGHERNKIASAAAPRSNAAEPHASNALVDLVISILPSLRTVMPGQKVRARERITWGDCPVFRASPGHLAKHGAGMVPEMGLSPSEIRLLPPRRLTRRKSPAYSPTQRCHRHRRQSFPWHRPRPPVPPHRHRRVPEITLGKSLIPGRAGRSNNLHAAIDWQRSPT